jgi:HEAT repeat protein
MLNWFQPKRVRLVNELLEPLSEKAQAKFLAESRRRGGEWMTGEFKAREQRRKSIAQKLAALGSQGIQELLSRVCSSEQHNSLIGKALREFGEAGWRSLAQLADEADLPKRRALIKTLWEFDEAAAGAVPWLIRTLDDADAEVRALAAHALGRIGSGAQGAAARLVCLAGDDVPDVRSRAMWALTRIGSDPAIAAQVFLEALMDSDPEMMKAGLHGLTSVDFDPRPYRPRLVEVVCVTGLESSDAFKLLRRCEGFLPGEIDALFELGCRDSGFAHFRGQLAGLLWEQTHETRRVFPLIERLLKDDDLEAASDALCRLGPAALPYAARLLDLIEGDPDYWDLAWAAVDALGMMGPSAKEFLPRVERLRSHPSGLVKARTDIAIRRICGEVVEERDLQA